ncbi:MAG: AbrB/MazE/SpoVT family DNA-binding domain-containing protein [Symbiobacteriia bacterium]
MESQVSKWGNSLGVRIPRPLAEKAGIMEGTPIVLEVDEDAIVIRRKRYSLQALLAQVTPENLHGEVDTGRPAGREAW